MVLFLSSKIGHRDVRCKLAMGLFGNLDSTDYLNLFGTLNVNEKNKLFHI